MTVLQRADLTTRGQKIQCAAAAFRAHGSKTALSVRYRGTNRCFAAILKRRCSRVRRSMCGSMMRSYAIAVVALRLAPSSIRPSILGAAALSAG